MEDLRNYEHVRVLLVPQDLYGKLPSTERAELKFALHSALTLRWIDWIKCAALRAYVPARCGRALPRLAHYVESMRLAELYEKGERTATDWLERELPRTVADAEEDAMYFDASREPKRIFQEINYYLPDHRYRETRLLVKFLRLSRAENLDPVAINDTTRSLFDIVTPSRFAEFLQYMNAEIHMDAWVRQMMRLFALAAELRLETLCDILLLNFNRRFVWSTIYGTVAEPWTEDKTNVSNIAYLLEMFNTRRQHIAERIRSVVDRDDLPGTLLYTRYNPAYYFCVNGALTRYEDEEVRFRDDDLVPLFAHTTSGHSTMYGKRRPMHAPDMTITRRPVYSYLSNIYLAVTDAVMSLDGPV